MKKTAWKVEKTRDGFTATKKITCVVSGEMDTGTKVWTEIETGQQYFLFRLQGVYYFVKE